VMGSYDELGRREELVEDTNEFGEAVVRIDHDPTPFLRFEFHRIDQRVRQRLSGGGRMEYVLALGLDRAGFSDVRVNEWRVAPRIDARLPLGKFLGPGQDLELGLGIDQEIQIFRLPNGLAGESLGASLEDLALLLAERVVSVTGLYADLAYRRGRFEARPGLRVDTWVQFGASPYLPQARTVSSATGVDPRLLLREQVGERWVLRQSLGLYHQPPDPPLPIPGLESIGLETGLQRNIQGSFGWEWTIADRATLTQDAYLGRLSNMQDYELTQGIDSVGAGSGDEFDDALIRVSGWAWGLETMLRLNPDGRIYGWLAYTLSWSFRDYPLGGWAPATWDQRHILNAVVGWAINPKWRLGGRLHVNSGRPYTARRMVDGELESLATAIVDHRNDARLPPFMQLDLRVERIFTLREFRLHLYLDLANANFAREVLQCDSLAQTNDLTVEVIDGCVNPQAIRYVLPALGLRAVF
ncbi:MAG: TonB-dependent receptor, partial [Myxococcales bacterium]|nr:TonB-dependent receptor [Myxococcales bacterium]